MKAARGSIDRAVDQPDAKIRFYLFFGEDESQSRALAARLLEATGATKFQLSAAAIKADPACLADDAGAMSLFGGRRLIWIEPATKDIEEGVRGLLDGPDPENPVIAIAPALTPASTLRKLAESAPLALAYASYAPQGQEAERLVIDLGRRLGLNIEASVAARLAQMSGNDRAIIGQELQKFALFLDASPHSPRDLDQTAVDEVGADTAEGEFQRLADLALGGQIDELARELDRLLVGGLEPIPIVRSLQRRLLMLAPMRSRIERGERIDAVMTSAGKALFWKDKPKIQRMLSAWSAEDLATVAERTGKLERALLFTAVPERESLGEELIAIARKARSGR